ncbi:hypothetical protein BDV26DRAFT_154610 [Aspergillus bertholletiae]|uniref:Uncharacterized protein n=1 Tax=Aspergillus bertholletiae TaxID=1226010 RepID=A0A5N7APT6_9EURO|nr:hypothetical protein BDV26DRAFT_154610 [Aspergillus bertholletiae]
MKRRSQPYHAVNAPGCQAPCPCRSSARVIGDLRCRPNLSTTLHLSLHLTTAPFVPCFCFSLALSFVKICCISLVFHRQGPRTSPGRINQCYPTY